MKRTIKYAAVAGLAGLLTLGMAAPSQARHGRNAAAAIGFGAGALVGAAAVNAAGYGNYGYAPRYGYDRDSARGYGAYDAYGYAPGGSEGVTPSCASPDPYGGTDYAACY